MNIGREGGTEGILFSCLCLSFSSCSLLGDLRHVSFHLSATSVTLFHIQGGTICDVHTRQGNLWCSSLVLLFRNMHSFSVCVFYDKKGSTQNVFCAVINCVVQLAASLHLVISQKKPCDSDMSPKLSLSRCAACTWNLLRFTYLLLLNISMLKNKLIC